MQKIASLATEIAKNSFYLLFFLVPLVMTPFSYELFEFNKMILVYGLTILIVGAWLVKMAAENRIVFRRTFWDIPLFIFLAFQTLSFLFSIDRRTSFWGYYSRFHGGLASSLAYLLLYWALVSLSPVFAAKSGPKKAFVPKNRLDAFMIHFGSCNRFVVNCLFFLLASGLLVASYGILEHFGVDAKYWVQDVRNRVFSTLGQPNWLAAWLAALIPLTWGFNRKNQKSKSSKSQKQTKELSTFRFLFRLPNLLKPKRGSAKPAIINDRWLMILSLFLFAVYFLCLLYSKSRSGLLAFGAAAAIYWSLVFFLEKSEGFPKKQFIAFGLTVSFLALLAGTPWTPGLGKLIGRGEKSGQTTAVQTGSQIARFGEGTDSGEIRRIVWQGAIEIWKDHPLFGTGPETFAYSYYWYRPREHNDVSEWDFLYNKAHNEYLNIAANTGSLGLLGYLSLIVSYFAWSFKEGLKKRAPGHSFVPSLYLAFFSGFLTILVTNFFGFSVVAVALLFFLFPALAVSLETPARRPKDRKNALPGHELRRRLGVGFLLCFSLMVLRSVINYWRADYFFAEGDKLSRVEQDISAVASLQKAVRLKSKEPFYRDALSVAAANAGAAQTDSGLIELAVRESDAVIRLNPYHLNFWKNRVRVFYTLAEIDEKYLEESLNALLKAKTLAPTDAKIYYNLALLYARFGQEDLAVETLLETVELKPNYDAARFALALFYEKRGETELAQEQYRYILEKINPEHEGAREKVGNG